MLNPRLFAIRVNGSQPQRQRSSAPATYHKKPNSNFSTKSQPKKLRCAILDDYQNVSLNMADWSALSNKVELVPFHHKFTDEKQLIDSLKNFQIAVIMRERTPFTSSVFSQLPELRLLVTSGMRNAAIDLKSAEQRNVVVCGTKSFSEPPAELTWGLILALARNIVQEHNAFHSNGFWQSTVGTDLKGKNLGILGLGKIGSQVARVGNAFGMSVHAWSQNLNLERASKEGVTLCLTKDELLEKSDFLSIHLVLSERTKGLIQWEDFIKMKRSAYFINTSRSQIVDQAALVKALQSKTIAGAGLDVYEHEPLEHNHPFRVLNNVVTTPHLGYVTKKNYKTYFAEAVEDITAFLEGKPIRILSAQQNLPVNQVHKI